MLSREETPREQLPRTRALIASVARCAMSSGLRVTFDVPAVGHACIVIRKYRRAVVEVVTCAVRCVLLVPGGHRTNSVSGTSGDMDVCWLVGGPNGTPMKAYGRVPQRYR